MILKSDAIHRSFQAGCQIKSYIDSHLLFSHFIAFIYQFHTDEGLVLLGQCSELEYTLGRVQISLSFI